MRTARALTSVGSSCLLALLAALAVVTGCGRVGAGRGLDRPNLVILTLDTQRADFLGTYGDRRGLTPKIDAFAADSVVFADAVAAIGTTVPSHATLFTGLYPRRHAVHWNGDRLAPRFETLAETLAKAGYDTAAFVATGSMLWRGGLGQGFRRFDPEPGADAPLVRSGEEVDAAALEWLAERGSRSTSGRPFFAWLHYFEAHSPYPLTDRARVEMARTGYDGPLARGASTEELQALGRRIPWTPAERAALRALYAGRVADLDRWVGEVLDALRRPDAGGEPLLARTLVVVTADHGQVLGEHDEFGHGFLLWQPVLAVPLIVHAPGASPRRVAERVGLVDLVPTLLEVLGLPARPGLDGRSFAGALAGGEPPRRVYFAEGRMTGARRRVPAIDSDLLAVFDGPLKAISQPGRFAVYDLAADPEEVAGATGGSPAPERERLWRLVEDYFASPAAPVVRGERHAEVAAELRSLGYVE